MAGKNTAVFGIYKGVMQAERAVDRIIAAGFLSNDISVLLPDNQSTKEFAHEKNTKAPEGTTTGGVTGGVIGGTLGLLAGIGVSRGLLRLFGMFGGIVDVDVEGRYVDVGLYFCVGAIEFDGLFLSGNGIDGSAENVALGVAIDVAGGLLDFDELRLPLKVIE